MKFVSKLTLAFAATLAMIASSFAQTAPPAPVSQFSTKTFQAPSTASIVVEKDANGNAKVTWDGIPVASVEHYIGHGKKGGHVNTINVGGSKSVMLADLAKNGGRIGLKTTDGTYVHVECGGNPNTTMPRMNGLRPDCSHSDPVTGQVVGALVIH